jgi:hypothetical protein
MGAIQLKGSSGQLPTLKRYNAVLVEISFVDEVLEFLVAGIQAKLAHDLAELASGDVAWGLFVSAFGGFGQ